MISALRGWIAAQALWIVGAVALAAVAWALTLTWRLHSEEAASLKESTRLRAMISDYNSKALAAERENNGLSQQLQVLKDENDTKRQATEVENRRLAASVRAADNGRLRNAIRSYASGDASSDSLNACRARAETLSDLLDEGMRIQVEGVLDTVTLASDYRALFDDAKAIRVTMKKSN